MKQKIKLFFLIISISTINLSLKAQVFKILNGYTDKFTYYQNDTFKLFLNSNIETKNFPLRIYDINGKVLKTILCDIVPQKKIPDLAYEVGFNYKVTLTDVIPALKSGVYLFDNKIPFIIKPTKTPDILVLYSSNTENAYCSEGGKSLYSYDAVLKKSPPIVSFLRPIKLPDKSTEFLKWINTQKNYDIGYICDKDMDDYENIKGAKLLIIPGHNEYWTRKARRNFDNFVASGNNALILSGNTMWWQVRYNDKMDQLICYKNALYDPAEDSLKTITWPDTLLKYSVINSIGLDFDHGGYGLKADKGWDGYKIVSPESPLLKNTGLVYNQIIKMPTAEYDGVKLNFSEDSSEVTLAESEQYFRSELIGYDFGSRQAIANGVWLIFQQKASSGVIINTGTTDWCSKIGMLGQDSAIIKSITLNMIDLMLDKNKSAMFTKKDKPKK